MSKIRMSSLAIENGCGWHRYMDPMGINIKNLEGGSILKPL